MKRKKVLDEHALERCPQCGAHVSRFYIETHRKFCVGRYTVTEADGERRPW